MSLGVPAHIVSQAAALMSSIHVTYMSGADWLQFSVKMHSCVTILRVVSGKLIIINILLLSSMQIDDDDDDRDHEDWTCRG